MVWAFTMFAMGFVRKINMDLISLRSRGTGRRQGTVLLVSLVGGSAVRQIRSISALGPFLCCRACESPQSERRDRPGIACRREWFPRIVEWLPENSCLPRPLPPRYASNTHPTSDSKPPIRKREARRGGNAILSVCGRFVARRHDLFRRKQAHFRFKHPAVPRGSSINQGFRPKYEDELPRPSRYRHSDGVLAGNFFTSTLFRKK